MARSSNNRGGGGKKDKKSITLLVGPFRMAFPALIEPEETDNGDRYKVTMLFPPDSKSIPEIEDALFDCMEDYFGPEKSWPTGRNDADPYTKFVDAGTKQYNGFKKGWMALTASSIDQPGIVDADKNEVLSKREVYPGRWARAQITITTYDNKSKGVTAYLNHVQLLEHDEAFDGRGSAEDAFDKYEMKDKSGDRRRRDAHGDERDDEDENRSHRGRRAESGRVRDDERSAERRGRGREEEDEDREESRGRGRSRRNDDDEQDEDRGRSRRRGSRDEEEDERDTRRGRSRERDDERDDERGRSRGEDRSSRGRARDEDAEDERPSRSRGRGRDEDREDDRSGRRGSSRSSRGDDDGDKRSRGRSRDDDDGGWN